MSGKGKADYGTDFRTVATWQALHQVLTDVQLQSYVFHFMQAVWPKIQELGRHIVYNQKTSTYDFCCRLMTIPFLPAAYIHSLFATIETKSQLHKNKH